MTQCGIGKSDVVLCSAESDLLVQMNYLALPIVYTRFKITGQMFNSSS